MLYDESTQALNAVLIDTWWNVNEYMHLTVKRVFLCFNRYMVECELEQGGTRYSGNNCFNRYMVECELFRKIQNCICIRCFNRYMVECECCMRKTPSHSSVGFNRYMVECESFSGSFDK